MRLRIGLVTVLLAEACAVTAVAEERVTAQAEGVVAFPATSGADEAWYSERYAELSAHHFRTLLEMGVGLGLGSAGYWLLQGRQVADWDNPAPEERFNGRAWRFDNNSLAVNFVLHPFAGGLAQALARANHHSLLTSFLYSSLTSFLWEFVLEFKEKVSVNDLIVTSPAGVPLGEFFHKLGLYLDTGAENSFSQSLLGWALGPGVQADRRLDGRARPEVRERDNLGYDTRIWHAFHAAYAFGVVRSPGSASYQTQRLGVAARFVTLPGYLRSRSFGRGFHRAEFSDFTIETELSEHGAGVDILSEALLAGYHWQSMRGPGDQANGIATTLAVPLGYRFLRSQAGNLVQFREAEALPGPTLSYHVSTRAEQYAALQLPGAALEWRARLPALEVDVNARLQPSFAGFGAPAFYDYAAHQLEGRSKHILHRQGYFYGWGGAYALAARLRLGPAELGGQVRYASYVSQQGLDRHIERVTDDVRASGDLLEYGAVLRLAPPELPVSLGLGIDVRRWRTEVGGFERRGRAVAQRLVLGADW